MPPQVGMVPIRDYNLTDQSTGDTVAVIPASMVQQWNQSMMPNPGAGALGTFGDALQVGANIIQAGELNDLRDDIRSERRRLHKQREALKTYLKGTSSGVFDPGKLGTLLENIFEAQDELDRSQTRALGTIQDVIWINIFGAGARIAGRMQGGGGGMGSAFGSGDMGGYLIAGGIGALLFGALDGDDFGRRRRNRD
jgi:hypothetical protein